MSHRLQQAVLGLAVVGSTIGIVALPRSLTSTGSIAFAPLVLFPYVLLALTSRAVHATLPQVALLVVSLLFVSFSGLTLSPSTDAGGGLIVVVVPALQAAVAIAAYVLLRLLGALAPRVGTP